jgi:hypothetical protein
VVYLKYAFVIVAIKHYRHLSPDVLSNIVLKLVSDLKWIGRGMEY